jgi:hypothetical protein
MLSTNFQSVKQIAIANNYSEDKTRRLIKKLNGVITKKEGKTTLFAWEFDPTETIYKAKPKSTKKPTSFDQKWFFVNDTQVTPRETLELVMETGKAKNKRNAQVSISKFLNSDRKQTMCYGILIIKK